MPPAGALKSSRRETLRPPFCLDTRTAPMSAVDENIHRLEELFAGLPGLGPRSASRIVSELLTTRRDEARSLCEALSETLRRVHHCPRCHALTTEPVCGICRDKTREEGVVCVVETPADLEAIENSVAYKGGYFVLMGRVNPMSGVGPEALGVPALLERLAREPVREVVLATSYTAEGETTAHLLAAVIKKHHPQVRVTRLARGLPSGVEIEYTDAATLAAAVAQRR